MTQEEIDADFRALLEYLGRQHVDLSTDASSGLMAFGRILITRSQVLNLVGQADRPRLFSRHVAECLGAPLLETARQSSRMVDIGSGGGLPGIPVALCCPAISVSLVEPRLRKAQFLESTVTSLGLAGRVTVFHGTAESFGRRPDSEPADLVTARAVDRLNRVWQWSRPLLRPGGWLVAFKGPAELDAELGLLERPQPRKIEIHEIPERPRVLVFLQAG